MNNVSLIPCPRNTPDTRAQLQELITTALQCPLLTDLAQKACTVGDPLKGKKGPIQVVYDPDICQQFNSMGFTDHTYRNIVLSTLHKVKALDILIFEVANASQTTEYRAMQSGIKDLTRDSYAKETERIEYTSRQLHHKVAAYGIEHLRWPAEVDIFKDSVSLEFEDAWNTELRLDEHAEWARMQYDSIRRKLEK